MTKALACSLFFVMHLFNASAKDSVNYNYITFFGTKQAKGDSVFFIDAVRKFKWELKEFTQDGLDTVYHTSRLDTIRFRSKDNQCYLLSTELTIDTPLLYNLQGLIFGSDGSIRILMNNKLVAEAGGFKANNSFGCVEGELEGKAPFYVLSKKVLLQVIFSPKFGYGQHNLSLRLCSIEWQEKRSAIEKSKHDRTIASGYFFLASAIILILIYIFIRNNEYLYFGLYCLFSAIQYITDVGYQGNFIRPLNQFSLLFSLECLSLFTALAITKTNRSKIPLIILLVIFVVSFHPWFDIQFTGTINGQDFSLLRMITFLLFICYSSFTFLYYWIQGFGKKQWDIVVLTYGLLLGISFTIFYPIYVSIANMGRVVDEEWELTSILGTLGVCIFPVAVAVVLAKRYGNNQKQLEQQVVTIKKLGEENVKKEIEKKKILEDQNIELEVKVKERTRELSVKNNEITDSLLYAHRIQAAILPDVKLIEKTLPQSFVFFKPKDIVSGDFYGYHHKNNNVIITCADCTGHGVSGALMSMIGSALLNQIINEREITAPAQILEQLNEGIIQSLKQKETETNDGMDVSIVKIDLEQQQLTFAGANRPLWLVRNKELIAYQPNKFPIGGLQIMRHEKFLSHTFTIQKNDTVYLFTDGYADQFGERTHRKIMTKKFKEVLLSVQHLSMAEQKKHLSEFFFDWKGSLEQVDDVLVIGIRL